MFLPSFLLYVRLNCSLHRNLLLFESIKYLMQYLFLFNIMKTLIIPFISLTLIKYTMLLIRFEVSINFNIFLHFAMAFSMSLIIEIDFNEYTMRKIDPVLCPHISTFQSRQGNHYQTHLIKPKEILDIFFRNAIDKMGNM